MNDRNAPTESLPSSFPVGVFVRECRLTITSQPHEGTEYVINSDRTVIGADPRADLRLDDATLSKFHCELRIVDGITIVKDLGSRNGTLVDQVPVLEAPLRDGALLTLGRTTLRFQIGTRDVALALSPRDRFGFLVGNSLAMRRTYVMLEAAATGSTTVLLQGESGTGKDLAAESIHRESARRDGPFIVVDCGAIPAQLLESELFGHEAGAFTGATTTRLGAFEAAHGGTLLLDEIGELALDLQPKLLRAIDRREIQRVGSTERVSVDVRVIAATNRDLKSEVNARRFRSDLYFRLAVLVVSMPPLRERASDIPMIVNTLLDRLGDHESPMARSFTSGALLPELMRHPWPGNIRELRNYIERCLAFQSHSLAPTTSAEPTIDITRPLREVREQWVRYVERRYLEALLAVHGNNVSAAAAGSGLDRVHLHRLLRRVGLR